MFKSIRWKFITIYFLLVFIAMVIVGVFIIQQFEEYYLNEESKKLSNIADQIIKSLAEYEQLEDRKQDVKLTIDQLAYMNVEIYVLEQEAPDFKIVATTNQNPSVRGSSAKDNPGILNFELIIDGRKAITEGDYKRKIQQIGSENGDQEINSYEAEPHPTKDMVLPIHNKTGKMIGILYLRSDLSAIYKSLEESRVILTKATMLALIITFFLGFFIARSVTEPINDVTVKAAKMARGDFDQIVDIKSDDEIGQLGSMFNHLTGKLKNTLAEISSEKSKLETILNNMADGLIAVNNGGRIIHANRSAVKMLGLPKGVLEHTPYDDMMGKLNEKLTLESIEEYSPDWVGSENIVKGDSIFLAKFAPFQDEKGEKAGIVMVLQDITERQKLDNMRKDFVANVSHELKTPLTSIKSYAETLLSGALDDRQLSESFLSVINTEADRMTRLVRDLLQLTSLDSKQVKWKKSEIDLVYLIENAVVKVDLTAKNKQQRIKFVSQEPTLIGTMDEDRIEQVLLNILSNAIKYTPEGGEIKIFLTQQEEQAIIKIIDNGMGIPKEDIPRLFERFYRVDKARSREMGGTGLGLSIAKQIIEAHDGSIDISSEFGEGTEVKIILPLREKTV
ncbi:MAG: ATP-binding protein [Bacillota bacterium]